MDPAHRERARRIRRGELVPVRPRHAATVVLLRDGDAGPEAYVIRRRRTMAFAPGMYAFPGGSVDRRDIDAPVAWSGPDRGWWTRHLGLPEDRSDPPELGPAVVCAAVRETFEESGVLLAGATPSAVVADTTGADWESDRMSLVGHVTSFAEFLERRGLVIRSDLLGPWAHWVTPRCEPRRFDTRFFVAALPGGQRTRDVSGEADRVGWLTPAAALASVRRQEMAMLPPTYAVLAELAGYPDVAAVLAAARDRRLRPVMPQPPVDLYGADPEWLLPGDPGYDESGVGEPDRGAAP